MVAGEHEPALAPGSGGPVHFIHVPKTGGTAVMAALKPHAAAHGIVLHRHATTLASLPAGERVFFGLRDPLERFVSAFNSRLRRGRPRYNAPWTSGEAATFARFATPDALGRALGDADAAVRQGAAAAMRQIGFVSTKLRYWLGGRGLLRLRRDDIVGVLRQERLEQDFAALCTRLGLPAGILLPTDPVTAHRVPEGFATALGPEARANLAVWYAEDIALDAWCRRFLSTSDGNAATPTA